MKSRKQIFFIIITLCVSLIAIIFTFNDYFLYSTPILKIKSIDIKEEKASYFGEIHYTQHITGIVKNGKYKGKYFELNNYTSSSGVYDEKLHKSSELFLDISKDGKTVNSILGIKRDKYLAILLVIFIDLILFVAGKKGVKTLISLGINIILTCISILTYKEYHSFINILVLYFFIAMLFIFFSLRITNERSKKTYAAIVSSFISLIVTFLLSFIVIKIFGKTNPYWTMEYIEGVYDYENYFLVSILLCGLGAIMDISITMSSSLNELIKKNNKISCNALIKSGKEISKDITGTMINVMLYTVYVSVIPVILIALRNNYPLVSAIKYYGSAEFIVILTSCISIVLSVPISLYTSVMFYVGKERKK